MSEFSGKCDFKDTIDIWGVEYILHSKIYIGNEIIPMKFDTPKDLIPYYPYLITIQALDENGRVIRLTKESWVDMEEREILTLYLDYFKKKRRACKRKKQEFNHTDYCNWFSAFSNNSAENKLGQRVELEGEKATIDGIHTQSAEYYRKTLYKEMVAAGYEKYKAYDWAYKRHDEQYKKLVDEYIKEFKKEHICDEDLYYVPL